MDLLNTAEGGSDETDVSVANSGGASGNAWDTVTIGASAICKYDTAQSALGSLSYRIATGASSVTSFLLWDTSFGTPARVWGRLYFRLSANNVNRSFARFRATSVQIVRINMSSTGKLELRNSANTVVATSTTTLATGTWYRVEYDVTPGTTATNTLNLYLGDSKVLTETLTATSDYSTQTVVAEVAFGQVFAAINMADMWLDGIDFNDVGFPGPAGPRSLSALGAG